jgi:class 3 adenylate cyclase
VEKRLDVAAVLFGDIADSTVLYRTEGNERAQALIEGTLALMARAAERQGGRLVKTIGDEVMCWFETASDAARAAIDMQRRLRLLPGESGENLHVRIGFAFGETVDRAGDVFGDVVNVAARLAALAKADQILTTAESAAGFDPDLRASSRLFDKAPVKGLSDEIVVVQVLWEQRNQTALVSTGPIDAEVARRLDLKWRDRSWALTPLQLPRWIGRSEECEIHLPAPFASRKHVRLEYRRGKFMLVDESSNGTYVQVEEAGRTHVVYVRNEAFALVGSGSFSLGTKPESEEDSVRFDAA